MRTDDLGAARLRAVARTRDRYKHIASFLLFCGGYAALIGWFKYVDFYHTHFSGTGPLLLFHNLFRILFVFYVFWIVQAAGGRFLRLLGGADPRKLPTAEYMALTFFAGAGPWHLVLLAVGYANLLNVPAMVMLTAPAVVLAFPDTLRAAAALRNLVDETRRRASVPVKTCCILLCLAWCGLLLVKGLYPGGSLDYFTHYFHSYESVIEHGSIRPAEMWWHYLNTKGAGLFFLGILLTDPLAPSLVTLCFMSVAGLALFLLVRRIAPRTAWPVVAVLLFFGIYVYTPRWGEFGKLHEFNTAFVIAIFWMVVVALDHATPNRQLWLVAAASAITAAVVINPPLAVFLGMVFGALAFIYVLSGEPRRGALCVGMAAASGVVFAGMLLLNFFTVGVPYDLGLSFSWRFADVEKLYRWGALPMLLWLDLLYSQPRPLSLGSFGFLITVLRLYLLWPLFLGGLAVAVTSVYRLYRAGRLGRRIMPDALLISIVAIVTISLLYMTSGRVMSHSFSRFSSFVVPVIIVASIAMWMMPTRRAAKGSLITLARHPRIPFAVLAIGAGVIAGQTPFDRDFLRLGASTAAYAAGGLSIDGAYGRQFGVYLEGSWGGIYPGARAAYAIVGPHTPIWSLSWRSYCMLPDCKMMTYAQFILTPSWDRVMWGTPEEGEATLRAAGVNYFLISRELRGSDWLRFTPLFSPDNIARHFGIRWTDGMTTLLTWRGSDTVELDDRWLRGYREWLENSRPTSTRNAIGQGVGGPVFKDIFERLNAMGHPWRPVDLPWHAR
jgi:hypothetical protein